MRLVPAFVLGLLWHLAVVWADLLASWLSLLILVVATCMLLNAGALAQVAVWWWLRDSLALTANLLERATRYLPGGGKSDGMGEAWARVESILQVLAATTGFAVVQFVNEMTQDVVGRIILLSAALVLFGLDLVADVWDSDAGGARSSVRVMTSGGDGEGAGDAERHRGLSASVPLPEVLGGGKGGDGGRLKFTLDL